MKVSVLVPTYNGQAHLSECLESVLGQSFPNLEILVSDDGSTDRTLQLIASFAARDSRIRSWQNPKNLGLPGNHNVLLQAAQGEYIKFVHQDDTLCSPDAVQKLAAALDQNPAAVLAGSRQHVTGSSATPVRLSARSGVFSGRRLIVSSLELNTNLIGQPTLALFRRSAAKRGFDPRFTGHLDYEMWFHLLEQGDFAYLDEVLATWRVHQTQQTARNRDSGQQDYEHLRFVEEYYGHPWLREQATPKMLFSQIYQLRKHYGAEARPVTKAMLAQLGSSRYAWHWLARKVSRPFAKLVARPVFP